MRLANLSVALAFWACRPLPHTPTVAPVTKQQPRMDEAIRAAREAFTRAGQAGDAEAMSRLFAADVVLITQGNDTIRGRTAIADALRKLRPGAEQATFWFARFPPLQNCVDGAYEHGAFTAAVWNTNGTTDTIHVPFAVRWTRDSQGTAQIQRVAFADREIARPLRHGECVDRTTLPAIIGRARARQESSRLSLTLYPFKQPFGGPSKSVTRALNAQGWHDAGYVCPTGQPCFTGLTPVASSHAPVGFIPRLGQLRYRFSRSIAAVAFISTVPAGSSIGLNDADSSELEFAWSGWSGGAMLAYQRFGFRAQVGPALKFAQWRVDEHAIPYNASVIYQARYHTTSVGVTAGSGYGFPVVGPLYLDLYAEVSRFSRTTLRGTPRFLSAPVTNNSYFVGFGLGLAF